MVKHKTINVKR